MKGIDMLIYTHTNSSKGTLKNLNDFIFDLKNLDVVRVSEYTYLINCLKLTIPSKKNLDEKHKKSSRDIMFQIARVNSLKELLCLK